MDNGTKTTTINLWKHAKIINEKDSENIKSMIRDNIHSNMTNGSNETIIKPTLVQAKLSWETWKTYICGDKTQYFQWNVQTQSNINVQILFKQL